MKVLLSILQVVRSQGADASTDRLSAIDYFGTGQANGAQSSSEGQEEEDEGEEYEVGSESGGSGTRTKRKQNDVERDVRTKKKKTRSNQEVEGNVAVCCIYNRLTAVCGHFQMFLELTDICVSMTCVVHVQKRFKDVINVKT